MDVSGLICMVAGTVPIPFCLLQHGGTRENPFNWVYYDEFKTTPPRILNWHQSVAPSICEIDTVISI
jgi:hypothetical protein